MDLDDLLDSRRDVRDLELFVVEYDLMCARRCKCWRCQQRARELEEDLSYRLRGQPRPTSKEQPPATPQIL